MPTLDEAVEEIIDTIREAIATELTPEVASVVRGDRARPMPALPAVWVVPEPATRPAPQETYGLPEAWELPVTIAGLVKADDPEKGGRECVRLAARGRAAAIRRRLDLPYIVDVVSTRFDAAARTSERNRNLYWADATIRVTFTVEEEEV